MRETPLTEIKGIGPKRAELFAAAGIPSAEALVRFFPRDYLDCTAPMPVDSIGDGQMAFVKVTLLDGPKLARFHGKTLVTARAADESGKILFKWFNQPYRMNQMAAGQTLYAVGRADTKKGKSLLSPTLMAEPAGLVPVYSAPRGLGQKVLRDAVRAALERVFIDETLPDGLRGRYGLMGAAEAVKNLHFPADATALDRARTRNAFETALFYLIAVENRRRSRRDARGTAFRMDGVMEDFCARLPFAPTGAQMRAMQEIASDMASPHPMNRLLQGDVGSGKTAVAMFAMLGAEKNGYQSALLAPTELLAEQHFITLKTFFGDGVCLLTGGMKKAERDAVLRRIASGEATVIVATHALFSADVRFHRLGLVITDEQHRFGVEQRAKAAEKGRDADVLVMSATPIPRTLALMLLADLDLSILDELPPGRKPVKTSYIAPMRRTDMYRYIEKRVCEGAQCYVVCPFIDDDEELSGRSAASVLEELKSLLPAVPTALLHGRQTKRVRDAAMGSFRRGETKILVTTTVIEVGVHVENATIMVIESADRFGLAQLHQLRGRVGRGAEQSYCFLLADRPGETAKNRIRAMTETNDGFRIAEEDFHIRGAGELIGTEQHGQGMWQFILSLSDTALLNAARETAEAVFNLPTVENNVLLERAETLYGRGEKRIALN